MTNLDAYRKYITTLDDFKRWLYTNKARLFRGLEVRIDTDEMIRVRNRIGLVIDLVFVGDDILIVYTWDKDVLPDDMNPIDYQEFEEFKAGETDYADLAMTYESNLHL